MPALGDPILLLLALAAKWGKGAPHLADRLMRVARLYAFAEDVLGGRDAANAWMRTPNHALDGVRPVDLLKTELTAREVEDLLGRIRHGIFA